MGGLVKAEGNRLIRHHLKVAFPEIPDDVHSVLLPDMKSRILAALLLSAGPLLAAFPTLQLKPVAVGQFFSPTSVVHAGDGSGRLFITDQRGKIYILDDGAILPVPFLDLTAKLVSERAGFDERGLLGLAFHPQYATDGAAGEGKFYVFYSAPSPDAPGTTANPVDCRSVISEYQVSTSDPNVANPLSERVLLTFNKPQFNHNGGQLAFGPVDGMLYFTTGDGGGSNDNDPGHTGGSAAKPSGGLGNSQDLTNLLGKLLRLDPMGTNGPGGQYGIPADNPFVLADVPGIDERKEIYAYGLRNAWRFSFDSGGAHRLFLADVGQGKFEEINLITPGGNYGWRRFEAFADFDATTPAAGPFVQPIAAYAHPGQAGSTGLMEIGLSVTGGNVYRGSAIPELQGKYVFGDWSATFGSPNGTLLGLEETTLGNFTLSKLDVVGGNPIGRFIPAFGVDEAGEMYVATKITLAPSTPGPGGVPSGQLFKIVADQKATLAADRDNSIFSDFTGNSNGAGDLFAGRIVNGPGVRRALMHFDLSTIPAGSQVTSSSLTLQVTKTSGATAGNFTFGLHRLTRDWGEGESAGIGMGAPAQTGEATWELAKFNQEAWTTAGGDFVATDSASRLVGNLGSYKWESAGLAADVQMWLDQPATNFGLILRGDESTASAKVFGSRHGANGPALEVKYRPPLTRREIWEGQYFPVGQFIHPDSDADFDRIPALLEYGWDLSPLASQDLADFFQVEVGASSASVIFRRDPRTTDLDYALETSTNLSIWSPVVTSTAGAAPVGSAFVSEATDPANTATRRVTASIPVNHITQPKLFIRLNVRRP